ncbi:hypothetical protein M5K25_011001 [Dendrobium thyrsiflorum]|uniref:Endonuclease/exonuclease/phosphatase domain-containing protein n=1 Tax=Dendrobium thyrsiflorum TaxID=117978 RepID=A0ABD0V2A0_DENTH
MPSLVFWNCRGARKREASLYLREIVGDHDVFFIGLVETKLANVDRSDVNRIVGSDGDFFQHPVEGVSSGILVVWNRNVMSFDVVEHSSQLVFGVLNIPSIGTWNVATVYGNKLCQVRRSLWEQLEKCVVGDVPSIMGGDFNCILCKEEKKKGAGGTVGPSYTWCNKKEGVARIWERLDRCLLNSAALQMVPLAKIKHLARVAFDHSPIVFKLDEKHYNKTKKFRFEDTWRSYPAAWSIVVNSWKKADFGNEVDVLRRKLRRTMKALFFWNKNKCKDLCVLKEQLKKEILELQLEESTKEGISLESLVLLRSKVHDLNVTLRRLSTWWNQRAKAKWHEEGDTNSESSLGMLCPGCAAAAGPRKHSSYSDTAAVDLCIHIYLFEIAVAEFQKCQTGFRRHQTFPPADLSVSAGGEELVQELGQVLVQVELPPLLPLPLPALDGGECCGGCGRSCWRRIQLIESFCESFLRVFPVVHTCHWVEGKRGRAWEREEEACEGEFVRCSQRLLLAKVQSVFSVRRPGSLKTLEVSTSARRNGSLPALGGSKRNDGSLPASGGSERSSGSLPHRVGRKSVL